MRKCRLQHGYICECVSENIESKHFARSKHLPFAHSATPDSAYSMNDTSTHKVLFRSFPNLHKNKITYEPELFTV